MEEILIGLFLSLMAKFIKNTAHAQIYRDQLSHIRAGIDAVIGPESSTSTGA